MLYSLWPVETAGDCASIPSDTKTALYNRQKANISLRTKGLFWFEASFMFQKTNGNSAAYLMTGPSSRPRAHQ